jgi:periplasmic protein TonB
MNFPQRQANPRQHLVGTPFVIPFHAFVVYAPVTGLAKNLPDLIRAQVKTKVIEEAAQ